VVQALPGAPDPVSLSGDPQLRFSCSPSFDTFDELDEPDEPGPTPDVPPEQA
jgi:hypothetical protein